MKKDRINAQVLSGAEVRSQFPFLSIPNSDEAVFESHFAGYISPRRLVKAQIAIAKKNGCQHIQEVVRSVTRVVVNTNTDADSVMEVTTDSGRRILARKVLVATGAFTAFRNVLGVEVSPDTKLFPLAVTKLEISEEDAQQIKYVLWLIYVWNSKYCVYNQSFFSSERCRQCFILVKEGMIGTRTTPWIPGHLLCFTCFPRSVILMVKHFYFSVCLVAMRFMIITGYIPCSEQL